MPRKIIDCRDYPSETNCTMLMAGEEDELLRAATEHAVSVHGHEDNEETREQIRRSMRDEPREFPHMHEVSGKIRRSMAA